MVMILGAGIDIEGIERFKRSYEDQNFLDLIYTQNEIDYCRRKKHPLVSFAGKFCAKEAIIKALKEKYSMKEIEIRNQPDGKIKVFINGKERKDIYCSISHTNEYAVGLAVVGRTIIS